MEYVTGALRESMGGSDAIGIKILVAVGRTLNQQDYRMLSSKVNEIHDAIAAETLHLDPVRAARIAQEEKDLLAVFGQHAIYVEKIPNGYCRDWCCIDKPWFTVTTRIGRITIGWCKRVISIDWEGTLVKKTADELFPQEDVTKRGRLIHAWGYEPATRYISVLLKAVQLALPENAEVLRASGDAVCKVCGKKFYDHQKYHYQSGLGGFMIRGCDGRYYHL